ncbi:MAG: hypothetical protein IKQ16_02360 [Lentisphaeria bacterium]|nr:hypothetical protein [Lentisphaeria bacterium]
MKTLEKIRRGLPLVRALKDKINEIIEYLRATRIVQGRGISVSESASGLVISVSGLVRAGDDEDDPYAFVTAGPGVCISGTSEEPAVAGGTNATVPLAGATISMLLEAGSDNVEITDGTNGSKVISVSGGTSEFFVPNYSSLAIGGMALSTYGHAITFCVAVKAGNINFWDEGNGAKGVYVDLTGTTVHGMTNKVDYLAPRDGFLRVSVYDDGSSPGECLSFSSPTGGLPLYKYGFMVSGITSVVSGSTAFIGLTGGTGSVRLVGENITISGNSNGEIVLTGATTGATGITSAISGSTISVSLTGGTGSVQFVAGSNVSFSGSGGVFTISATGGSSGGGGDGFVPDWWYNGMITGTTTASGRVIGGATDEVMQYEEVNGEGTFNPSTDAFIVPSGGGYLYAFASIEKYSDSRGDFSGSAHLMVNGAAFKVAELSCETRSVSVPISGRTVPVTIEFEGTTISTDVEIPGDTISVSIPAPSMACGSSLPIPVQGGAKVWWRLDSTNAYIRRGCVFYAKNQAGS